MRPAAAARGSIARRQAGKPHGMDAGSCPRSESDPGPAEAARPTGHFAAARRPAFLQLRSIHLPQPEGAGWPQPCRGRAPRVESGNRTTTEVCHVQVR